MQSPVRTRMQGEASGLFAPISNPALLLPVSIGLDAVVAHPAWREAGARIQSRALAGAGVVLLTGAPGSGKSLLLQDLAQALRQQGVAVAVQPDNDFSLGLPHGDRALVVIIDGADPSSAATAEGLRRLNGCAVVLAGVADAASPALRGATVVTLGPLQPGDVAAFMEARLARAGLPQDLFSSEALAHLALRSGGVPRALNTLANASLLVSHVAKSAQVSLAHVQEAEALGVRETRPELSRMVLGTDAFGRRKRIPTRMPDAAAPPPPPAAAPRPSPRAAPPASPAPLFAVAPPLVITPMALPGASQPTPLPPRLPRYAKLPEQPAGGGAKAPVLPRVNPDRALQPRLHRRFAVAIGAGITLAVAGGWLLAGWNHTKPQPVVLAQTPLPSGPVVPAASPPVAPQEAVASVQPVPLASTPAPDAIAPGPGNRNSPSPELPSQAAPPLPAPAQVPLPSSAPLRVVLHFARTNPEAAAQGMSLSAALRAAGYQVAVASSRTRPDMRPAIRYFFAEDRDAALRLKRAANIDDIPVMVASAAASDRAFPGLIDIVMQPASSQEAGVQDAVSVSR